MSFGLGYIADGFLKGQERNRSWGLRQKQEERSQAAEQRAGESHGVGMRIDNVNAHLAEEKVTPDAIAQRKEESEIGIGISRQNLENVQQQGVGIKQQNDLRSEDLTPEAVARRQQSAAADLKAKQLGNQYQEYVNTKVGKEVSKEALAWEKHFEKIVSQTNEAEAKVMLSEAIDMKRYRMLELIDSGDGAGAALFVNSARANKLNNVAVMKKTDKGGVVGYDTEGNEVVNIPADEVKGIRTRMAKRTQSESARNAKAPTTRTIKQQVMDENGAPKFDFEGNPVTTDVEAQYDPTTNTWKPIQLTETTKSTTTTLTEQDDIDFSLKMVQQGKMTIENFKENFPDYELPISNEVLDSVQVPRSLARPRN